MKSLRLPSALVLSDTPLDNRLDDLFSVIEFIDDRWLGPAARCSRNGSKRAARKECFEGACWLAA